MAVRAIKFRKTLDKVSGGNANYIFLGDLNTMGLDYPYKKEIESIVELKRWDTRAKQFYGLRRLIKTHDVSWSNGSASTIPDSNLDHVYASEHLKFKQFNKSGSDKADVSVRGWVNAKTKLEKDNWIKDYSDHSLLFLEVQKV
jgi:hypothetical protein